MRKWTKVKNHPNLYEYPTDQGKRFGVRRGYKDTVGNYKQFSKSGYKTWREADIVLKKFESDLALKNFDNLSADKVKLEQVWRQMVSEKERLGRWRTSTADSQNMNYDTYIKKALGNYFLSKIKRPVVQSWLDSLSQSELAHDTIRSAYGTLSLIINYAVSQELLGSNRIRGLDYSGKDAKNKSIEPIDFNKWMKCAKENLNPYDYNMIFILANSGMRRGEINGLRTTSIEIKENQITKERYAVVNIDYQRSVNEPNGGELKTKTSYRKIVMTGESVNALENSIETANLRRTAGHKDTESTPWLWVKQNGDPSGVLHLTYLCKTISTKVGIKMHPHMFRHYFATETIAHGVPQIDVMHYLGHSSVQMTADYTRPTEGASLNVSKGFSPAIPTDTEIVVQGTMYHNLYHNSNENY